MPSSNYYICKWSIVLSSRLIIFDHSHKNNCEAMALRHQLLFRQFAIRFAYTQFSSHVITEPYVVLSKIIQLSATEPSKVIIIITT